MIALELEELYRVIGWNAAWQTTLSRRAVSTRGPATEWTWARWDRLREEESTFQRWDRLRRDR